VCIVGWVVGSVVYLRRARLHRLPSSRNLSISATCKMRSGTEHPPLKML